MSRFGSISPEARARLDAQEARRKAFVQSILDLARKAEKDFSYEGDEGEPGHWLKMEQLSSNYPWLYLHFRYSGSMYLSMLVEVETRLKALCASVPESAHYLDTKLWTTGVVRYRLIHREDIEKPALVIGAV